MGKRKNKKHYIETIKFMVELQKEGKWMLDTQFLCDPEFRRSCG